MNPLPTTHDRHDAWLRRLAVAAVLLMLMVVVASAWLRLAQPRPDCVDWPGCRSVLQPPLGTQASGRLGSPATLDGVRVVHRVAASTLLPIVIALVVLAWIRRPRESVLVRQALAMLALALGLAGLGIVTPGARSAWILLGNLLGGLGLLALAWAALRGLHDGRPPRLAIARWALIGAVLWALQAALGALSGARFGEPVAVAHLALAVPAALWAFALGWLAAREGRGAEGKVLMALAAAQPVIGAMASTWAAAPGLVLAHNASAAIGVALLFGLGSAHRRP